MTQTTPMSIELLRNNIPNLFPKEILSEPWFVNYGNSNSSSDTIDKIPRHHKTGIKINAHEEENRATFKQALEAVNAGKFYGVGIVISNIIPFMVIDLDDCRNPDNGNINESEKKLLKS